MNKLFSEILILFSLPSLTLLTTNCPTLTSSLSRNSTALSLTDPYLSHLSYFISGFIKATFSNLLFLNFTTLSYYLLKDSFCPFSDLSHYSGFLYCSNLLHCIKKDIFYLYHPNLLYCPEKNVFCSCLILTLDNELI